MTIEFITSIGMIVVGPIVWALAIDTENGVPHTAKALLGQSNAGSETGAPEPPGAVFTSFRPRAPYKEQP